MRSVSSTYCRQIRSGVDYRGIQADISQSACAPEFQSSKELDTYLLSNIVYNLILFFSLEINQPYVVQKEKVAFKNTRYFSATELSRK